MRGDEAIAVKVSVEAERFFESEWVRIKHVTSHYNCVSGIFLTRQ